MSQQEKINKDIKEGLRPEKKYTLMSEDVKGEIRSLYESGVGAYRIAKKVGYSKCSVLRFLVKEGIVRKGATYRKHKFKDEHYFDQIDSDEKAYFLGLLWADGCNYRRSEHRKQAYQVSLCLTEEDGYMVRDLAKRIFETDDVVILRDRQNDKDRVGSFKNRKNQISLRFPSKHISDTLLNYGMVPRKSSIAAMPINVEWTEGKFRSFLRGLFDGDGSIYYNSHSKHYGVSLIGAPEQISQIKEMIEQFIDMTFFLENVGKKYSVPMSVIKIHGNIETRTFCDWLYKGSTIHLNRKYQKYLDLIQMKEGSLSTPLQSDQSSTHS